MAALLLFVGAAHCGSVVTGGVAVDASSPSDAAAVDTPPIPDGAPVDGTPPPTPSPSCAEVRAQCGGAPAMFVRGHAQNLTGLDGARARFAVRYSQTGSGGTLSALTGVVSAWGHVRDGAFEACVCVPTGANIYPVIVSLVYAPGSASDTSRDVVRAVMSQRYATLGDEDLDFALTASPSPALTEAAVAAMDTREAHYTVATVAAPEGTRVFGGLVADERTVAAEVSNALVAGWRADLHWTMPGRAWPSERVALVVDRDNDRRCGAGDLAAFARANADGAVNVAAWMEGAAIAPVCAALQMETTRAQ